MWIVGLFIFETFVSLQLFGHINVMLENVPQFPKTMSFLTNQVEETHTHHIMVVCRVGMVYVGDIYVRRYT